MLQKIIKTKDVVKELLIWHPHLRDSDDKLIANIWNMDCKQLGLDPKTMTAFVILSMLSEGKLTSFEAVSRARRRVQEACPELRGENYKERQKNENDIREKITEV